MEYMATVPDKWFDLACIDPPYGIGEDGGKITRHHSQKKYIKKGWDKEPPDSLFFNELIRVSKNQIIWGANHFIENIPNANASAWIFWDKDRSAPGFSDGEMAWTNFGTRLRKFYFTWDGFRKQVACDRIHPTEKPIALYSWIYANYLPQGGKVFDSHLGSGSNRIAADKAGNINFYATEIDKDYFEAQEKRWRDYKAQAVLTFPERIDPVQSELF